MKTAYKFLKTGLESDHDRSKWEIGKWREETKEIKECVGLNASKNIVDALKYVQGEILAKVEYSGVIVDSGDKITCSKMRIIKAWECDKLFFVDIAIHAAESVIDIFEKEYPNDDRPKKTIKTTKEYLKNPSTTAHDAAARAAAWTAHDAAAAKKVKKKLHSYILNKLKNMKTIK